MIYFSVFTVTFYLMVPGLYVDLRNHRGQGDGVRPTGRTGHHVGHLLLVLRQVDVLLAGGESRVSHPVPELVLVGLVNTCATSTHPSTCIICFNIIVFNVIVVIIVIIDIKKRITIPNTEKDVCFL